MNDISIVPKLLLMDFFHESTIPLFTKPKRVRCTTCREFQWVDCDCGYLFIEEEIPITACPDCGNTDMQNTHYNACYCERTDWDESDSVDWTKTDIHLAVEIANQIKEAHDGRSNSE